MRKLNLGICKRCQLEYFKKALDSKEEERGLFDYSMPSPVGGNILLEVEKDKQRFLDKEQRECVPCPFSNAPVVYVDAGPPEDCPYLTEHIVDTDQMPDPEEPKN
jgi:hypothetical protein